MPNMKNKHPDLHCLVRCFFACRNIDFQCRWLYATPEQTLQWLKFYIQPSVCMGRLLSLHSGIGEGVAVYSPGSNSKHMCTKATDTDPPSPQAPLVYSAMEQCIPSGLNKRGGHAAVSSSRGVH